eukprot:TRINITY_DN3945_c0_g1_i4.p1 TRINITY_DN3945_c0_g1~~TRINITY_DN3945_c0_g1_i4.p1  ORF type:complete len:1155 (+),score=129.15 TRINITY_DN3945_c0_g1_i4:72-3467(+)
MRALAAGWFALGAAIHIQASSYCGISFDHAVWASNGTELDVQFRAWRIGCSTNCAVVWFMMISQDPWLDAQGTDYWLVGGNNFVGVGMCPVGGCPNNNNPGCPTLSQQRCCRGDTQTGCTAPAGDPNCGNICLATGLSNDCPTTVSVPGPDTHWRIKSVGIPTEWTSTGAKCSSVQCKIIVVCGVSALNIHNMGGMCDYSGSQWATHKSVDIGLGVPSAAPVKAPSQSPSRPPSLPAPTRSPSLSPAEPPTLAPSQRPTAQPRPPTAVPSRAPSLHPSATPSRQPSVAPSAPPSTRPSLLPTAPPSTRPSLPPTAPPSPRPSLPPTAPPSPRPSLPPTAPPSPRPTQDPSVPPSVPPSARPTPSPAAQPTLLPTAAPSLSASTGQPTAPPESPTSPPLMPTQGPTAPPTVSPQPPTLPLLPTNGPTYAPREQPSTAPTTRPSPFPALTSAPGGTGQPSSRPAAPPPSEQPWADRQIPPTRQPRDRIEHTAPPRDSDQGTHHPVAPLTLPPIQAAHTAAPVRTVPAVTPTVTATPTVEPAGQLSAAEELAAAAGGLVSTVKGMTAMMGPLGARLAVITQLNCFVDDLDLGHGEELDIEFHPLGIAVGSGHERYFVGAVLCNAGITLVCVALLAAVAAVLALRSQESSVWAAVIPHQAVVRFPSFCYLPYQYLNQGSALASVHCAFFPLAASSATQILGGGTLILYLLLPPLVWWTTLRGSGFRAVALPDTVLEEKAGMWGPARIAVYRFVYGTTVWSSTADNFVERFGIMFEVYAPGKQWWILPELLHMVVLALFAAWSPSERSSCDIRNFLAAVMLLAYFLVQVLYRPYLSMLTTSLQGVMALLNFLAVALIAAGLADSSAGALRAGSAALVVSACCQFVNFCCEVSAYFIDLCIGRRKRGWGAYKASGFNDSYCGVLDLAAPMEFSRGSGAVRSVSLDSGELGALLQSSSPAPPAGSPSLGSPFVRGGAARTPLRSALVPPQSQLSQERSPQRRPSASRPAQPLSARVGLSARASPLEAPLFECSFSRDSSPEPSSGVAEPQSSTLATTPGKSWSQSRGRGAHLRSLRASSSRRSGRRALSVISSGSGVPAAGRARRSTTPGSSPLPDPGGPPTAGRGIQPSGGSARSAV